MIDPDQEDQGLLDVYAGLALAAMPLPAIPLSQEDIDTRAKVACDYADALLAERRKRRAAKADAV